MEIYGEIDLYEFNIQISYFYLKLGHQIHLCTINLAECCFASVHQKMSITVHIRMTSRHMTNSVITSPA